MKSATLHILLCTSACLAQGATGRAPAPGLGAEDRLSVLFMKQEEKMARDVYQALAARWDQALFSRIAASEQRHMDAIDGLIARYGLVDTTPVETGRYSIPELQTLHDELMARGTASLSAALEVGVSIEQADIDDLEQALAAVRDPVVRRVFGQLLLASGHHLTAFTTVLESVEAGVAPGAGSTLCPGGGGCGKGMGPGNRGGAGTCTGGRAACDGTQACGIANGGCQGTGVCPNPNGGSMCPQAAGDRPGAGRRQAGGTGRRP